MARALDVGDMRDALRAAVDARRRPEDPALEATARLYESVMPPPHLGGGPPGSSKNHESIISAFWSLRGQHAMAADWLRNQTLDKAEYEEYAAAFPNAPQTGPLGWLAQEPAFAAVYPAWNLEPRMFRHGLIPGTAEPQWLAAFWAFGAINALLSVPRSVVMHVHDRATEQKLAAGRGVYGIAPGMRSIFARPDAPEWDWPTSLNPCSTWLRWALDDPIRSPASENGGFDQGRVEAVIGARYGETVPPERFGLTAGQRAHLVSFIVQNGNVDADTMDVIAAMIRPYKWRATSSFHIRYYSGGRRVAWITKDVHGTKPAIAWVEVLEDGSMHAGNPCIWRSQGTTRFEYSGPADAGGFIQFSADGATHTVPVPDDWHLAIDWSPDGFTYQLAGGPVSPPPEPDPPTWDEARRQTRRAAVAIRSQMGELGQVLERYPGRPKANRSLARCEAIGALADEIAKDLRGE